MRVTAVDTRLSRDEPHKREVKRDKKKREKERSSERDEKRETGHEANVGQGTPFFTVTRNETGRRRA